MEIKELLQQAEERMNKSIEALKHEFASIRTGRASVALLDKVMVDYYGSPSPINQVANISVPEPRMIVIAPWDKTMIGAIEKAILRLAVYELQFEPDVPYKVAINEAIEVAKVFGADESHKYINGVLDKVAPALGRK